MSMVLPSQAYGLQLKPHPAPISVLSFNGEAQISALYKFNIEFTSPVADIPMDQVVGRSAVLTIAPIDPQEAYLRQMFGERWKDFSKAPEPSVTHGVIDRFETLGTSADETRYRVTLVPKIAELARGRTCRLFQKQSVVEIITDTLRHYDYRLGVDFDFKSLRGTYKRLEYETQFYETTFAFIQRLCAEAGTFREKFLFVDICGFDLNQLPEASTQFELEFVLKKAYPSDQRFTKDNVRLFCSPVINLFQLDAETVTIDHHETEYRVVPAGYQGGHVETYSVDAVESFDHLTSERYEYVPFATFRHRGGMLRHESPERYFHTRVRAGLDGLHETWLILGGNAWESMADLPEESLSLRVTGTNGLLPRKGLREARLDELAESTPNVGGVRNLVAPTLPLYPPTGDRFQWRVLSHLAPNFLSMMNAEVLRGALALYDWTNDELNRRRLAGILHVSEELLEEITGGAVERGVLVEVTLDSQAFSGEGDVMLFGELLHRFFELYAEVNLFTKLALVTLPSKARIEWPRSKTHRAPL